MRHFATILIALFVVADLSAQTVYITKSGTKYHTSECSYLKSSRIPISLEDAKSRGYGACSVCKPPK